MKKLYVDAVSLNGGGAFVLETGKQAELVYAGVTVYSMSPRERPDLRRKGPYTWVPSRKSSLRASAWAGS